MATPTKTSWFAPKLRSALERKEMSVRALARAWRPNADMETSRRSLNRYLNTLIVPSAQVRRELAEALGIDPAELEPDDDEEPHVAAVRQTAEALLGALMAAVAHASKPEEAEVPA